MNYYRLLQSVKRRLGLETHTDWTKFPNVIHLDTTNKCGPLYCKLYCSYCYPQWNIIHEKRDEYGYMPLPLIHWILEEIERDGRTMSFIPVFWSGDALMEHRLPTILGMIKSTTPWLRTQTFTCGTLTQNVDLLLDRNLDEVCFTCSAHTPSLWNIIHRGKPEIFNNVCDTIKTVLEKRPPHMRVEVHMVLTKDNYMYAQDWWDFFGSEAFQGLTRIISPLVETVNNTPSKEAMGNLTLDEQEDIILRVAGAEGRMWTRALIPQHKPCVTWDDLTIDWQGYILQCCNWYDRNLWNYGRIQDLIHEDRTLKSVWIERLTNRMRNPVCRTCNMLHPKWKKRLRQMNVEVEVKRLA